MDTEFGEFILWLRMSISIGDRHLTSLVEIHFGSKCWSKLVIWWRHGYILHPLSDRHRVPFVNSRINAWINSWVDQKNLYQNSWVFSVNSLLFQSNSQKFVFEFLGNLSSVKMRTSLALVAVEGELFVLLLLRFSYLEAYCSRVVIVEGCQWRSPSQEPPRKAGKSRLFAFKM